SQSGEIHLNPRLAAIIKITSFYYHAARTPLASPGRRPFRRQAALKQPLIAPLVRRSCRAKPAFESD
ncbi:hypothetical protein, partial [Bacillus sp. HSTU-bmb18]|uniref:hypothetical protein n=1 Tax=Bacillus sp. HSTU-bmb18 TaxID=2755318 RepID=UPI0034C6CA97